MNNLKPYGWKPEKPKAEPAPVTSKSFTPSIPFEPEFPDVCFEPVAEKVFPVEVWALMHDGEVESIYVNREEAATAAVDLMLEEHDETMDFDEKDAWIDQVADGDEGGSWWIQRFALN